MTQIQENQASKIAMAIMAHPDDAEFGVAGTVAAWSQEGWEIYYVIIADGSGGGPDDATDVSLAARHAIAEIRKREQRAAGAILGVKEVLFLDYPDGRLVPTLEMRRDIVRVLRRYCPSRVLIQSPERSWQPFFSIPRHHPDHLAAGEASLSAIYPASQNPWDFPELLEEGLEPHRVREVFISGAPTQNFAVDISHTLDLKIEALKAHLSQTAANFEQIEQRIRTWASDTGQKYEMAGAEEFYRVEN